MPQWAGSCWYYLRYLDPLNEQKAWDPAKEHYWMPVDLYVGGAEHAVLHLLYARFWHKALYDLKLVSTPEPFQKLVNQGLILGEDGEKMSKSRGNVVNPDDIVDQYGADAFRLYEMFMGPLEAVKPWSTRSIEGVDRFLQRVWRLGEHASSFKLQASGKAVNTLSSELERKKHEAIKRVTEDIEHLRLNTAISTLMEFVNAIYDAIRSATSLSLPTEPAACSLHPAAMREAFETLVLLLSPFAPHLAEELWQRLGHKQTVAYEAWPSYDAKVLEQAEILWIVQVNGRIRARLTLPASLSDERLREAVLADGNVKRYVNNNPIKQFIVVPKRLVSIVV
jgi:leucyl-tRNA synthetase